MKNAPVTDLTCFQWEPDILAFELVSRFFPVDCAMCVRVCVCLFIDGSVSKMHVDCVKCIFLDE